MTRRRDAGRRHLAFVGAARRMSHARRAAAAVLAVALGGSPARAAGPFERMAALHETLVSVHQAAGIAGLFTYDHDPAFWLDDLALGKLRVGVRTGDTVAWLDGARDLSARNTPDGAGVEAAGSVGGTRVRLLALPAPRGRDTLRREGLALFRVTCSPPAWLTLRWTGPGRVRIHGFRPSLTYRVDYLTKPDLLPTPSASVETTLTGATARLRPRGLPLTTALRLAGAGFRPWRGVSGGVEAEAVRPVGGVSLMAAFAEAAPRAADLARADAGRAAREVRALYRRLTGSAWTRTPSPAIDGAFRAALVNLEYAWVRPYGWIESPHHWGTLYSQQQNLAADWIGQAHRSREMLLTHAAHLTASGQVPQLDPYGRERVDFGGWNQFYAWGVRHYWRATGDHAFARRVRDPLRRVVEQTLAAHDPDGNGLLGFGQQIHNQEDYITTPEDGSSPTIAGIEMLRAHAEVTSALGDRARAERLARRAAQMAKTLRRELWDAELGRYPYYRDALGVTHLDGQYHALTWPVQFGLLDDVDAYTSMRHLADTLTGPSGEVYVSNNFPSHVMATVGSQAGGQQQPWATVAWARLGDADRAARPLEWIARLVTGPANAGAWPEVAEEWPSYFTPPAGVFVWGVVEGLFGLELDRPAGTLDVRPCLPASWPRATLHLPAFDVDVRHGPARLRVECRSADALRMRFRVPVPPASRVSAMLGGRPVAARIRGGVRVLWVSVSAPAARRVVLEVRWKPLTIKVAAPRAVTPGSSWRASVTGARVVALRDPSGLLTRVRMLPRAVEGRLREGAGRGALTYGPMGARVLTRRTLFVACATPCGVVLEPIDFALRPDAVARLALRATAGGTKILLDSGRDVAGQLTRSQVAALRPGINRLRPTAGPLAGREVEVDAAPVFAASKALRALSLARLRHVALPAAALEDDGRWREWRWWSAYGHPPWSGLEPPLRGLSSAGDLAPPNMPGLTFASPGRRVAVASRHLDRPTLTVPLAGRARTVYLLLLGLLDNGDVFAPVGRVTVRCGDGTAFGRMLHFPGDLDWWGPRRVLGDFATVASGWTVSPTWEAPSSVMNVIAVDLGAVRAVESVLVETIGRYPALGVVGVTLSSSLTRDSAAALPPEARALAALEPISLFRFDTPDAPGWERTGTAWGITDSRGDHWGRRGASRWFANSMAGGESATGTMTSPPFRVEGRRLSFLANGHGQRNHWVLLDAVTGAPLRRAAAPERTGPFVRLAWDLRGLSGRMVRFRAVDAETAPAYAWIGFDDIVMEP